MTLIYPDPYQGGFRRTTSSGIARADRFKIATDARSVFAHGYPASPQFLFSVLLAQLLREVPYHLRCIAGIAKLVRHERQGEGRRRRTSRPYRAICCSRRRRRTRAPRDRRTAGRSRGIGAAHARARSFHRSPMGRLRPHRHYRDTAALSRCPGQKSWRRPLARFETVPEAADAAAAMHRTLAAQNAGLPEDQHFHLRAGINAAMAWSDGIDIYGTGVNLAARLATLAGPGETIASASAQEQLAAALASLARPGETIGSAAARDELTHGVDASCEDLGDCILKHFDKPVRAYRVGPASPHPNLTGRRDYGTAMQPTIAVIPFSARNDSPGASRYRQFDCRQRDLATVEVGGSEGDFTTVDRCFPRPRERCRRGVGASRRHLCPQRRVCCGCRQASW